MLKSSITTKDYESTLEISSGVNLKPKIGIIKSCVLHAKAPRKSKFILTVNSIQFWRGCLKKETIKQMAHTGICVGYMGTLSAMDTIRKGFDSVAVSCKTEIEQKLATLHDTSIATIAYEDLSVALAAMVPNIEDEINESSDAEVTMIYTDESEDDANIENLEDQVESNDEDSSGSVSDENDEINLLDLEENTSHLNDTIPEETMVPGFTFCWDNIGKKVTSRHPTQVDTNKYLNMALGYMTVNRIPASYLTWDSDNDIKKRLLICH